VSQCVPTCVDVHYTNDASNTLRQIVGVCVNTCFVDVCFRLRQTQCKISVRKLNVQDDHMYVFCLCASCSDVCVLRNCMKRTEHECSETWLCVCKSVSCFRDNMFFVQVFVFGIIQTENCFLEVEPVLFFDVLHFLFG
jgi:hypothetical protein